MEFPFSWEVYQPKLEQPLLKVSIPLPKRILECALHTATPPVQKCDGKVREGAPREHAKEGFNHTE